jgi:transcriptional regulator with XRE-family HTH domain
LDERGENFGEMLRRFRSAIGVSQQALAARSGLSVDAIGMLERGVRTTPRSSTVVRLAGALRLRPSERDAFLAVSRRSHRAASAVRSLPPAPAAGVPPDPIAHFVDRETELLALGRLLHTSGRAVVHGLGGIGKTQLAVRYLHQGRAAYPDGRFWLRADREASLIGDLASLAWHLELPQREAPEPERQIEAVLRWLRERAQWLIVVDDLEPSLAGALQHWLPPGLPGHVLLTSRTPMWSSRIGLGPLPPAVASGFLLERTGQHDPESAGAVADTLGRLPLALEQAAAYLEVSGRDLAGYARLLRTRLVELMAEGKPEGYPRPVATTWLLSFERLERERPAATALLRLCAFLAPDEIPVALLQAGAPDLPHELRRALADDVELDRSIAALRRYSLLERQGEVLRVHRLVQAVVRESMTPPQRRTWRGAAGRVLRRGRPRSPSG